MKMISGLLWKVMTSLLVEGLWEGVWEDLVEEEAHVPQHNSLEVEFRRQTLSRWV